MQAYLRPPTLSSSTSFDLASSPSLANFAFRRCAVAQPTCATHDADSRGYFGSDMQETGGIGVISIPSAPSLRPHRDGAVIMQHHSHPRPTRECSGWPHGQPAAGRKRLRIVAVGDVSFARDIKTIAQARFNARYVLSHGTVTASSQVGRGACRAWPLVAPTPAHVTDRQLWVRSVLHKTHRLSSDVADMTGCLTR